MRRVTPVIMAPAFLTISDDRPFPTFFVNSSPAHKEIQNRRYGAIAAGAKSPKGIQTSSANAVRHGLLSKVPVLSNESPTPFDEILNMYMEKS